jgi:hypothetical protein
MSAQAPRRQQPAPSTAPPAGRSPLPAVQGVLMEAQERLLARARTALDQQRLDEAASAIETARKAGIATERVAQLATELARAREQAKASPPRAASALPANPAATAHRRRDCPGGECGRRQRPGSERSGGRDCARHRRGGRAGAFEVRTPEPCRGPSG